MRCMWSCTPSHKYRIKIDHFRESTPSFYRTEPIIHFEICEIPTILPTVPCSVLSVYFHWNTDGLELFHIVKKGLRNFSTLYFLKDWFLQLPWDWWTEISSDVQEAISWASSKKNVSLWFSLALPRALPHFTSSEYIWKTSIWPLGIM